mgnify:CR=1 FL=1
MIKRFLVKAAAAALAVSMLSFFGCSDSLNENNNMAYLLASKSAEESVQYGSITINGSRSIDVSTLTSATVTVSGYDMDDIEQKNVDIVGGLGYATIRGIKVGKNRVVTVKSNIDGAVMRGVCDVEARDDNACTVNWASTAVANVYYYLTKAGTDVSSIESSSFSSKIPEVHACLFKAEDFAAAFKAANFNANGLSADDYIAEKGTLKVVSKNASGYTVQITDIASEKVTLAANGTTTLAGYPGTWKVKVFDSNGNLVEDQVKDVIIGANADTTITVEYGQGVDYSDKTIVFVKKSSAPDIWAWETNGVALSDKLGGTWEISSSATKMVAATSEYMADPSGWYMIDYTTYATGKTIVFKLNWSDSEITGKAGTFWYDGSSSSTTNPSSVVAGLVVTVENPTVPVAPTATIAPDSDTISVSGAITVTLTNGNDTISAASVTVSGAASKTYSYSDFTNDVLTIKVSDLGITEADKTITVNASVTNSVKTVTATPKAYTTTANVVVKNTFTWDNVNCYFVLTDRFYNGDKNNDGSYGRVKTSDGVGSFHGGDIKGLTEKLDYLEDLGVNAIWISAPYEQTHGWTSGANNGFAHYAFHGYYTQDWTFMDQAMGTIEEFRTFVNEAHKRGIRVVMDIVMNHTGYDNWQDMIDYGFGGFKDSYSRYNHTAFATDGKWIKGDGSSWGTNWDTQDGWFKWWSFWVRGFSDKSWPKDDGVGYWTPAANVDSDPLKGSLQGLPDVVTEKTDTVNLPTFLKTKWYGGSNAVTGNTNVGEVDNTSSIAYGNETGNKYKDYQLPPVSNVDWYNKSGDWRTDGRGAQSDYQVIWLSAWVREFGVDGFRCDTAKHVDLFRWGQLKDACESALAKWRADSTKADTAGAKEWKDKFWMVGEAWGHGSGTSDSYFSTGKFDSMINFSFQGSNNTFGSTSCGTIPQPTDNDGKNWINYANIGASTTDTDSNGNCNSTLSYLSSHDTGLLRHGNMKEVGTKFILLPAGIQIYYGDESWRPYAYNSCGDSDMMTRGDMNWGSNTDSVTHWGKLGKFRKFNPAVGAGSQTTSGSTYIRKFTKTKLSGIEANTIAISLSSTTLSGLPYSNGTTVYNWYDGKSATVQNGSVTFSGSSASTTAPVLCSDRNPADYGVTF